MTRRYAFPVDATTVVIRTDVVTPLEAVPTGRPGEVQLVLAQPSYIPPLTQLEADRLRPYFRWEQRTSFWWRTLYPAIFQTQLLSPGIEAGRLVQQGEVIPAPGVYGRRPAGQDLLFSIQRPPPLLNAPLREPWSPVLVRRADGNPVHLYRSRALQGYLAEFPAAGPERVWLRLLRGRSPRRSSHLGALEAESALLLRLQATLPGAAAQVLHCGTLEAEGYAGPYAALRPAIGIGLESLLAGGGALWPAKAEVKLYDIASSLLGSLAAAHRSDPPLSVGVLTPRTLVFRPARGRTGARVQAVIIAAPASRPIGTKVPRSAIDLFPEGAEDWLKQQFDDSYIASVDQDLRGLGLCLRQLLQTAGRSESPIAEFFSELARGIHRDALGAMGSLERWTPLGR
ncbi:MAG TPA: hypothetical protein VF647_11770 [Longimicrobium sp.]